MAMCKKDTLLRMLRKARIVHGKVYDFFPLAFILPTEYTKFVKEYSQQETKGIWICKPADSSRGRKIFLIKELTELMYDSQYLVQKYVAKPLLVGGYKMDLRIYVLVTSFHPLKVFLYEDGLARFGTTKYDNDMTDLGNLFSHLTNRYTRSTDISTGHVFTVQVFITELALTVLMCLN
jgi:tubulin polyglutamylase TTLL2